MNPISALLAVSMAFFVAHGAPLGVGNSMQPEFHATALIPMLTGTNVPESEEEIDAPIYDEVELEKIKGLVKQTIDSHGDLEKAPVMGDFVAANPAILSTAASMRASGATDVIDATSPRTSSTDDDVEKTFLTSPHPIFTLSAAVPTVAAFA